MNFLRSPKSLKNQLLLYFVLLSLVLGIIFGVYYYITFTEILHENIGVSQYRVVSELMANIDGRMGQVYDNINWICVNQNVVQLLKKDPKDIYVFDDTKKQAIRDLNGRFKFSAMSDYISAFYIIGKNGLDIREGDNAYLAEPVVFKESSWYMRGTMSKEGHLWGNVIKNYAKISFVDEIEHIIPYFKKIIDIDEMNVIGYIIAFFDPQVFFSLTNSEINNQKEAIFLVNHEGTIISSTNIEMCGQSIYTKNYYETLNEQDKKYFIVDDNMERKLVVYKKSDFSDWSLIKELPLNLITSQKNSISTSVLLIIIVTIFFAIILSILLTENFVRPIHKLVKNVNEIAKGNFNLKVVRNRFHSIEIEELSNDIENMAYNIQELMIRNLEEEKEKKQLELKMLQNQINPHFLYNTLSSVSWMASIQRSYGIKQTIDSLMKLLDFSTKNLNKEIMLEDELEALEHYMNIQKIRYKGKVSFQINYRDDDILTYTIPKFILQPIVENAVFHGIEPKNGTGEVTINVYSEKGSMFIEVWDNGVGIGRDKIKKILEHSSKHNEEASFKAVGLSNVNRRIKLICGAEYGISLESTQGEYTKVIVKLPAQRPEGKGGG